MQHAITPAVAAAKGAESCENMHPAGFWELAGNSGQRVCVFRDVRFSRQGGNNMNQ